MHRRRLFHRISILAMLFVLLAWGCTSNGMSEEERRARLFLAPGSMGLSLVMPSGGTKGIQSRVNERKLRSAAEKGDDEEVRRGISEGADINARNDKGWNALTLAVNGDHYTTASLLLRRVNHAWQAPNIVTKNEALAIAVQRSNLGLVELLLKNGASPDSRNVRNETVLMRAAFVGSPDVMKILLEAGADAAAFDKGGFTARDWARIGSCEQCLELLEPGN